MNLEGQGGQRGYAMAALLVAMAVMAVLMTVAMPVWRHQAQREKEAELIFRGEQWVKGLQLYQRKNGPGSQPASLDMLVQQRLVRKKWLDPITGKEFVPVYAGQQPGQPQAPGGRGAAPGPGGRGAAPGPSGRGAAPPQQPPGARAGTSPGQQGGLGGGILGVRSSSTESSIRTYRGATRYDQWAFIAVSATPGGGGRGAPGGGRGAPRPGINPGGRGGGTGGFGGGGGVGAPGGRGRGTAPNPGRGRGGG